jgi:hypothetical protein
VRVVQEFPYQLQVHLLLMLEAVVVVLAITAVKQAFLVLVALVAVVLGSGQNIDFGIAGTANTGGGGGGADNTLLLAQQAEAGIVIVRYAI